MKKRILAALLAASMALCAGCGSQSDDTAEDDQTPSGTAVEVTEVTQGAMSTEYSVNGKVAADNEVQVFPMLAGQVLTLSVSEGDKVSKGQTLLSVDTSTVTSTMSSLRRVVQRDQDRDRQGDRKRPDQRAAGAACGGEHRSASRSGRRRRAGPDQGQAGSGTGAGRRCAGTRTAGRVLAQIQASMDQINKQASLGTVTAPCAGTVTTVNVVQGGMASSAQPAVVIAEDSRVKIKASVSEDVFAGLHVGDSAGVQISVLSDEVKTAKILSLPAAANQQTNLYDVSVSVPEGSDPAIGSFATVIFYTDRRENTLSVPTECVLTGNDNERYLFTVDEGGTTAKRVTVETGLVGKTQTEITSGLTAGDRVVTKGQSYLSDGLRRPCRHL